MGKFTYEDYLKAINKFKPKLYKAKLTDDLEIVAKIYYDGQVTLSAVYKGSNYETSFDEKNIGSYHRHWNSETKTARYYLPELVDECKTEK